MKVVVVPFSAMVSEDKWTADFYVPDQVQDEQRLAGARRKLQQALSTIVNVCKRRREARERLRRLGVRPLTQCQGESGGPGMNILLTLFLSSLWCSLWGESELYAYGFSYHSNRDYPFKEFNPGVGYGYTWNVDSEVVTSVAQASAFRNSYGEPAGIVTVGPRIRMRTDYVDTFVSINGGFTFGHNYGSMVLLPSFGISYDRFLLFITLIPQVDPTYHEPDATSAVAFSIGARL